MNFLSTASITNPQAIIIIATAPYALINEYLAKKLYRGPYPRPAKKITTGHTPRRVPSSCLGEYSEIKYLLVFPYLL